MPALALALGAFAWCWTTGSRGFFALDQSIALDGGWRVLGGQVPFVDFRTPHGLPLFVGLAGAFALFGASHATYLGVAALQNAAAALLAASLVERWTGRRAAAWTAGIGTALWFQAPHGTPFSEQTAFLLALAAWRCLVPPARAASARRRCALDAAAGALLALAVLCKQNAGGLSAGVALWILVATPASAGASRARRGLAFVAGALGVLLAFGLWLFLRSDPVAFWESYVVVPSGLLAERLRGEGVLAKLLVGHGHAVVPAAMLLACLPPLLALRRARRRAGCAAERARARLTLGLCLGLHLHQSVFTALTHNHPENGYPFAALGTVLGFACLERAFDPGRACRIARATAALVLAWVALRGVHLGVSRTVHNPVLRRAHHPEALPFDGWRHLRWAVPTLYHGEDTTRADLVRLVAALRARGGNLFAFPEHTFLYALLERPSPQPLLWFDAGVTYPRAGDPELERRIVADLERHDVRTVVLEERAFLAASTHLERLPRLAAFLGQAFAPGERIGPYRLLVR